MTSERRLHRHVRIDLDRFQRAECPHAHTAIECCLRLLSSNLLEAELRAACAREETDFTAGFVSGIEWVLPNRPPTPDLSAVLEAGYLKGADLWHVATACYLAGEIEREPAALSFVTLDARQRKVAATLGFQT